MMISGLYFCPGVRKLSDNGVFLEIEKGDPYEKGKRIYLTPQDTILGREWNSIKPDISFSSMHISKRHAMISCKKNTYSITDLMSKHGTQINGQDIEKKRSYNLKNGDAIILSRGIVLLKYCNIYELESGDTVDFTNSFNKRIDTGEFPLAVNIERREVILEGNQLVLYGKDLELLLLLYLHQNKAVSYDEIRRAVWPERILDTGDNLPDVGNDEITALVYRLRKRLGQYGCLVITVPRYGYMLNFKS